MESTPAGKGSFGPRALAVACLILLARPVRAISPEADKLVLDGLDAAYSFDFERSEKLFQ